MGATRKSVCSLLQVYFVVQMVLLLRLERKIFPVGHAKCVYVCPIPPKKKPFSNLLEFAAQG